MHSVLGIRVWSKITGKNFSKFALDMPKGWELVSLNSEGEGYLGWLLLQTTKMQ